MGLRGKVARLQKALRGRLECIELADGTRYWYEPEKAWMALYRYYCDSLRAEHHGNPRPEPPEVLRAVARAKDREKALRAVYPEGITPCTPVDVEALASRGEFVPRPLVAPPVRRGPQQTDGSYSGLRK